jgi:DNA-binding CsgD family transcriptional regulator
VTASTFQASERESANPTGTVIVRPVLCKPFVGRRAELAYLRERRLEAGASRGGLVFVAGDAGLGKTRLISEFCRSLAYSRWRITSGPCREFGGRPYGPILDALANIDPSAQLAPAESKQQYFEAIVAQFAEFAARKALVVVIEDVHWADAATLDLLAYLGSRLHNMRVLVLASFRPDDLHAGHPAGAGIENVGRSARAGRIDLAPLAGVELRTFIDEALSGFTLGDDARRSIALTGEGNPFFTEELLKNAVQEIAERRGRASSGSASARVPHGVRSTLLERLRPLDDNERRIITQAAVIGRTFSLGLLESVTDIESEGLLPALRRARDFQLIEELEPSVFRFRHGLTRDAICSDFLSAELRPLHRRIALSLEMAGERTVETLAYHWWAAGDDERSAHYNVLTGDAARAIYAHEDAIAFYRRALEAKHLDALARGSILEKIANIRLVLSNAEEGLATYNAAADAYQVAGASEREAVCRVRVAMTDYTMRLNDTSAPLERMLERLDASDYLARARLHLGIAWIASALRFPSRAKEHLAQVDARAATAASDVAVRYHNVAACVATDLVDVDGFRREHVAWLEAARVHGSGAIAGAYYNGAKFFASFALFDDVRENIRQALQAAHELKSIHAEECAHATAALCHVLSGDLRALRVSLDAVPTTTDNLVNLTFARAAGTAAATYLDDDALIETWFDGFDGSFESITEIECGYGFAELLVRRGRLSDAQALLHRVLPDCEVVRGQVMTLLSIARHGVDADRVRAREYLVRAAALGDSLERPALALFDAIRCSALEPERARSLAAQAAEGFRRLRTPLLEADARELAGDVDGALSLYRRCGAAYHVRRLEHLAGASAPHMAPVAHTTPAGQTTPVHHTMPASHAASSADALTAHAPLPKAGASELAALSPREREIVVLAADGQSNLEIARNLSISHKTVEKHLGAAFQKLGVSSRRALRDYVR